MEIEAEVAEAVEASPVRQRPRVHLRPAPKWGAVGSARSTSPPGEPRARRHVSRSRSRHRTELSAGRLFALSKAPTRLLRHKAADEGLPLRADGFFSVEAIIRTSEMRALGARSADILQAIHQDAKQRYRLRHFWVRAVQGHSQSVNKDLVMQRLNSPPRAPSLFVPRNSCWELQIHSAQWPSRRRPLWVPYGYSPGGASARLWPEGPVRMEVQL